MIEDVFGFLDHGLHTYDMPPASVYQLICGLKDINGLLLV